VAEGTLLIETELFVRTILGRLHWVGVNSIMWWIIGNERRMYETGLPKYLCLPTTDTLVMIMHFGNEVTFRAARAKHTSI
jgi:hypothetical protein